jgi:phosphoribosyl 1,2-cyclic phosphate phosphodiesterase
MQVTFLGSGTSQGVPVIGCQCSVCLSPDMKDKRLRASIRIVHEDLNVIIDSGPDFRQQCLRESMTTLDAIVFTHGHKDHLAGLDDVRAFNFVMQKKVDIYCDERVDDAIRREFPYIFHDEKYPGVPEIEMHRIGLDPFYIGNLQFIPIEVMHYRLPVLGFRIGNFTYITDANYISPEEKEKIKGSKVLVLNALRKEAHISHFTLDEAVALAQELGAQTTYFTHISHQLGLHQEIENELPQGIKLAYDQLQIEIN